MFDRCVGSRFLHLYINTKYSQQKFVTERKSWYLNSVKLNSYTFTMILRTSVMKEAAVLCQLSSSYAAAITATDSQTTTLANILSRILIDDEHWPLNILPGIFNLSVCQRVCQIYYASYPHSLPVESCLFSAHLQHILRGQQLSKESCTIFSLPGPEWIVTLDTCIYRHQYWSLCTHPAPFLSVIRLTQIQ